VAKTGEMMRNSIPHSSFLMMLLISAISFQY
jgi:hypothetical protein